MTGRRFLIFVIPFLKVQHGLEDRSVIIFVNSKTSIPVKQEKTSISNL